MSSLANAIAKKEKSNSTSSKTPQFYNEEKNRFIVDITSHVDPSVRLVACSNFHCPAKILQARLRDEEDVDVLRAILMNPNLSKKAMAIFATTDIRAKQFDGDQELIDYVQSLSIEQ
jgi:hypothetical protein